MISVKTNNNWTIHNCVNMILSKMCSSLTNILSNWLLWVAGVWPINYFRSASNDYFHNQLIRWLLNSLISSSVYIFPEWRPQIFWFPPRSRSETQRVSVSSDGHVVCPSNNESMIPFLSDPKVSARGVTVGRPPCSGGPGQKSVRVHGGHPEGPQRVRSGTQRDRQDHRMSNLHARSPQTSRDHWREHQRWAQRHSEDSRPYSADGSNPFFCPVPVSVSGACAGHVHRPEVLRLCELPAQWRVVSIRHHLLAGL